MKALLIILIVILALFALTFTIYFFNLDMKFIRIVYDKMGKHYDNLDKKDKKL
jgi:flagellar basal body-associated protein FliL